MNIQLLENKKIIIWGTGYVAEKFYCALVKSNMQKNIICFTRTNDIKENEMFIGIPVLDITSLKWTEDMVVCLSIHESLLAEVESQVKKYTNEYIWIYPYLYRWLLGKPIKTDELIEVKDLVNGCKKDLRMAIRLAAVEAYYNQNTIGNELYCRAEAMHCSKDTAEHRLLNFSKLISSWEKTGYQKISRISVDQNGNLIDGNHRLSMAIYHCQQYIVADVFDEKNIEGDVHNEEAMITENALRKNGFSKEEIEELWRIQDRYFSRYL